MFKPLNTSGSETSHRKVLIYGAAGVGKTTQAKFFQQAWGPGFIMSGESGLSSVASDGIDYLPFSSFAGKSDPENGVWSFSDMCVAMRSKEFADRGYKWIMLDSLTELSDLVYDHCEREAEKAGKKNGFQLWGDYAALMLRSCKFIRDLPYTVVISALEKSAEDDNGRVVYRPMVKGNGVSEQLPGIFDFVFNLVASSNNDHQNPQTVRRIITSTVGGRIAKSRDESRVLKPVEETDSVVEILARLSNPTK